MAHKKGQGSSRNGRDSNAQRRGVNVTIGLPVIRTSVDHGSAYDIAGRGVAQTDSLLAAYELAEAVAGR